MNDWIAKLAAHLMRSREVESIKREVESTTSVDRGGLTENDLGKPVPGLVLTPRLSSRPVLTSKNPSYAADQWIVEVYDGVRWKQWETGSLDDVMAEMYAYRGERFDRVRIVSPLNEDPALPIKPCSCSSTSHGQTVYVGKS